MSWQTPRSALILASLLLYVSEAAGQQPGKPTSTGDQVSMPDKIVEPSKSDRDRAQRHLDQGAELFNHKADYQAALAEFEAAYQLFPDPSTLINIGLAQKELYRYPEAVASLQRYLETSKKITPEETRDIRADIDEMRARLAEVTFTITPHEATVVNRRTECGLIALGDAHPGGRTA